MKKLNSILLIVFCFAAMTLFVKQASARETNEVTADDIISVVNDAKTKDVINEVKNEKDLYHGYLGDYKFISQDIVKDDGKDVLILEVSYTNTTDRRTKPVLAFLLDTNITQNINGLKVQLNNDENLIKELKSSIIGNFNKIVLPGEQTNILIPVILDSNDGTVSITDLMSNGAKFSKLINL